MLKLFLKLIIISAFFFGAYKISYYFSGPGQSVLTETKKVNKDSFTYSKTLELDPISNPHTIVIELESKEKDSPEIPTYLYASKYFDTQITVTHVATNTVIDATPQISLNTKPDKPQIFGYFIVAEKGSYKIDIKTTPSKLINKSYNITNIKYDVRKNSTLLDSSLYSWEKDIF